LYLKSSAFSCIPITFALTLLRISERIHYASFYVAEAKFQDDIIGYHQLIKAGDSNGLEKMLTRGPIEEEILRRVRAKVIGIQENADDLRYKIDPEVIVQFYEETIIPLTRQGEVMYLLSRSKTLFERGQQYAIAGSKATSRSGWMGSSKQETYSLIGTLTSNQGTQLSFKDVKITGGNINRQPAINNNIIIPLAGISQARLVN